jgi:hypothetical protein
MHGGDDLNEVLRTDLHLWFLNLIIINLFNKL